MKQKMCIFISNESLLSETKNFFKKESFDLFTNSIADDCTINEFYETNPDIILLDLEISNTDGIELCYKLTSENALNAFIVLFSSQIDELYSSSCF